MLRRVLYCFGSNHNTVGRNPKSSCYRVKASDCRSCPDTDTPEKQTVRQAIPRTAIGNENSPLSTTERPTHPIPQKEFRMACEEPLAQEQMKTPETPPSGQLAVSENTQTNSAEQSPRCTPLAAAEPQSEVSKEPLAHLAIPSAQAELATVTAASVLAERASDIAIESPKATGTHAPSAPTAVEPAVGLFGPRVARRPRPTGKLSAAAAEAAALGGAAALGDRVKAAVAQSLLRFLRQLDDEARAAAAARPVMLEPRLEFVQLFLIRELPRLRKACSPVGMEAEGFRPADMDPLFESMASAVRFGDGFTRLCARIDSVLPGGLEATAPTLAALDAALRSAAGPEGGAAIAALLRSASGGAAGAAPPQAAPPQATAALLRAVCAAGYFGPETLRPRERLAAAGLLPADAPGDALQALWRGLVRGLAQRIEGPLWVRVLDTEAVADFPVADALTWRWSARDGILSETTAFSRGLILEAAEEALAAAEEGRKPAPPPLRGSAAAGGSGGEGGTPTYDRNGQKKMVALWDSLAQSAQAENEAVVVKRAPMPRKRRPALARVDSNTQEARAEASA